MRETMREIFLFFVFGGAFIMAKFYVTHISKCRAKTKNI